MKNVLFNIIEKRRLGIHSGIPSFCCSNKIVIEAILEQSRRFDDLILIEATSNQVNQDGGYTGMTPMDFKNYTYQIADKIGFDKKKIILGGDHMGPLPWADLPAKEAMENAKKLVKLCVFAGYKKIHLDTSMRLGDDDENEKLSYDVIAERGVILFKECEKAYKEMLKINPDEIKPVFVIGSEVPIPGGVGAKDEGLSITDVEDFENTIIAYKKKFKEYGLDKSWQDVIAIVVQPGVEFGVDDIHLYDRVKAQHLCNILKQYPDIVFEGHSTDYQPPSKLKEMVKDGIAIIKVGPALSFALREGLFALAHIEKYLITDEELQSHFMEVLEEEMVKNDKNWKKYYHGNPNDIMLARKFSFSDRCRYYFINQKVEKAIQTLFKNIDSVKIPMGLLHQYMPLQYNKVRDGILKPQGKELVKDAVISVIDDYNYAVKYNYIVSGVL